MRLCNLKSALSTVAGVVCTMAIPAFMTSSRSLGLEGASNSTFFSQEFRYVPGAKFPVASNAPAIKPDAPFDFSMFDNLMDDAPKYAKVSLGSLALSPENIQSEIDYFTKCIVARLAKNWPKVFDVGVFKFSCEILPLLSSQIKYTFDPSTTINDSSRSTVFAPCVHKADYKISESEFVQQLVDAGWIQPSESATYSNSCERYLWKNVYQKFRERTLDVAAKTSIPGNASLARFLEKNLVPGFPASAESVDAKVKASGEILSTHVSQWLNSQSDLTVNLFDPARDLDFNAAYDTAEKGASPDEILATLVSFSGSLTSPFIDELAKDPIRKKAVQERLTQFLGSICISQKKADYSSCLATSAVHLYSVEYVFEGTSRFAIVN